MGKYDYFVKLMNDYNKAEDVTESNTEDTDQEEATTE